MKNISIIFMMLFFAFAGCDGDEITTLSVTPEKVDFGANGGSKTLTVKTSANSWTVNNPATDWLSVSASTGTNNASLTLTVSSKTLQPRSATLIFSASDAKPVEITVTQASSEFLYVATASPTNLSFSQNGESIALQITTDAPQWDIASDASWLQFSAAAGVNGTSTVDITAAANEGDAERTAIITVTAANAPTVQVSVTQKSSVYPNYNTSPLAADEIGMASNAAQLAAKMKLGFNIGNAMEAIGGETAWGNPKITGEFIDLLKQNGFNAIRIPCSWNQYMQNASTAKLKTEWLDRVKEVVQLSVDREMYVLLNIHWDGGWLENNCTPEKQAENNAKQKAFWQQIATHLRDFDEHLLFASANEPNVENATQMAVLNSYHKTFIDAVRETGGKNSYRVLVVQGPSTDIEKTNNLVATLPTDQVEGRLMMEIHYYTPWNFCGLTEDASWGKMFYYWGAGNHSSTDTDRNPTWGEESTVDANFQLMKTQFVDKGIPVVLGEYAATRRATLTGDALTKHLASRAYFLKYVTAQARAHGLIPFYWDNGSTGNDGSGIFNRNTNAVADQQALDALLEGSGE